MYFDNLNNTNTFKNLNLINTNIDDTNASSVFDSIFLDKVILLNNFNYSIIDFKNYVINNTNVS